MANYEEYAEKHLDPLQEEITDAQEQAEHREENAGTELPERFRDKTPEEIAASYVELERKFSQQGNDLGVLRQTVDKFMELQSTQELDEPTPEADPVTVDDIYEDPEAAIRKVVQKETATAQDKIAELEAQLQIERYNAQLDTLDGKYEGWRDVASSEEFRAWVHEQPYRMRMAQMAEAQDITAADGLMGLWYDSKGQAGAQRQADLRNASLESGGPVQPEMVETFSRAELMNHRVAAKMGDTESIAFLKSNAEAIAIAYEEGHITD